jgi:2-dehydro-3-deoxy-D-arabinonate dehydratase
MRYYRIRDRMGDFQVLAEKNEGQLTSLTSINDEVRSFDDLLRTSHIGGQSVDDIARHILSQGEGTGYGLSELIDWSKSSTGEARLVSPIEPDEMWAGGPGNYLIPDEALNALPEMTRIAHNGDRPAVLYKGTASRLSGPFDSVGVRADTEKTVAEGELVLVVYKGKIVGYSTGNEVAGGLMTNTLWWSIPSKVFSGCASLGPCIATPETISDPTSLEIELVVTRAGKEILRKSNITSLRRSPEDIVNWSVEHDSPPDVVVYYTGGCVAGGEEPMQPGDVVRISLEGVGYVENTVVEV